ncbi:hypothetical protein MPSD_15270 [Mycobacterium pseudoshottsii JCM 15466]|uniref:Uncharacterized protein n=1 Tax=Mycobacterium pseudoshottsii TaxID=265949 RepID=A0A9N7LQG9_9MYCO|nr:hypothetical protein MMSP_4667 [Mycobacterium sp. 012931]BBA87148.1 hypothetical protein MPSD_15270 [Mycobacterium pseudoshottsii JCM 15466]BDN81292.1 hypothetical protein NJB1907Z4_C15070 [Mycobacterium pseudoshottsii]
MRTLGGASVGQSGSPVSRRTDVGTISAAGWLTSKGNAPNNIGADPERSAAWAAAIAE